MILAIIALLIGAGYYVYIQLEPECAICRRPMHKATSYSILLEDESSVEVCCPRCGLHFQQGRRDVADAQVADFSTGPLCGEQLGPSLLPDGPDSERSLGHAIPAGLGSVSAESGCLQEPGSGRGVLAAAGRSHQNLRPIAAAVTRRASLKLLVTEQDPRSRCDRIPWDQAGCIVRLNAIHGIRRSSHDDTWQW